MSQSIFLSDIRFSLKQHCLIYHFRIASDLESLMENEERRRERYRGREEGEGIDEFPESPANASKVSITTVRGIFKH